MSLPLILGCLWVLAATATALLPMRRQYVPGVTLLLVAPLLLGWIGYVHGWLWVAIGLAAFASMMRNPLIYLYRRARGERPEVPK
ncbi:MAG: DUF2484 family protein [Rhodobacterales bacterium]|nr:DUF2484 family protein [Rhodobacterales bacterium]NCT11549.1 DUF2484 family protein [Rhodobacterales bacterium]